MSGSSRHPRRRTVLGALPALLAAPALSGPDTGPPAQAGGIRLDLTDLEARHGGRLGVHAADGRAGATWRADERFPYCSTFKLFLAACMLDRVRRGLDRLDRAIPVTAADMVPHSPVTGPARGSSLTLEVLIGAVASLSDNPAANILIRELGGLGAFASWYRAIGDGVTRVDRAETELNSAAPGDLRDTTTPSQFGRNLERVLSDGFLRPDHLALLSRWLVATPTGGGRLRAAAPPGVVVAHKTGTGDYNTCNDIGLFRSAGTPPVRLVVFYTGASDTSAEDLDAVVAEAARRGLVSLDRGV